MPGVSLAISNSCWYTSNARLMPLLVESGQTMTGEKTSFSRWKAGPSSPPVLLRM